MGRNSHSGITMLKVNLTELTIRNESIQGDHPSSSAFRLSNWLQIVSITKMDRFPEEWLLWGMQVNQ